MTAAPAQDGPSLLGTGSTNQIPYTNRADSTVHDNNPHCITGNNDISNSNDPSDCNEPKKSTESSFLRISNQWRPLPKRVRTVWLINEAIGCAIWLVVCGAIMAICIANNWWGFWQQLIVGLFALYVILDFASQPLQTKYLYAFTRFRIGEHDLATRKGWLVRTSTTTPYTRVQHVDTKQNPVQRYFNLTTVVIHTASDQHEIAALDTAEAERIVALITERVAAAKEDL